MNRKRAYDLAITAIELKQQQFWLGHLEYLNNGGPPKGFEFAERDHKNWEKWEKAKSIMESERDHQQERLI